MRMNRRLLILFGAPFLFLVSLLIWVGPTIDFRPRQIASAIPQDGGCRVSRSSWVDGLVDKAQAAYYEPLRDPVTNIPDPFSSGVITHGCNPPDVDILCNGTQGPCTIQINTAADLSWTTISEHPPLNCTATATPPNSNWSGGRPPAGSQSTGNLTTLGNHRFFLTCTETATGLQRLDRVRVIVIAGPVGGISVNITADGSDFPITRPVGSDVRLEWTTTGVPTSCDASNAWTGPRNPAGGFQMTGPLNTPGFFTFAITCRRGGLTAFDSASVNVQSLPSPAITGDIYAGGRIRNLRVTGPAVVSAETGTPEIISCGGDVYCVSNYSPRLRNEWRGIMNDNLTRLRSERAQTLTSFPPPGNDFDGTPDRLGGGVWRRTGSISVAGRVTGRGTLIVDGDITVTADLVANSPIGIVSRTGNITIAGSVGQTKNVYFYAPLGRITFDPGTVGTAFVATGAFIAREFSFATRELEIVYDSRVALTPPPGFVSFILPTILERAP